MSKHIKQLDTNDCGVACASMITKFFGINLTYNEISNFLEFNNNDGVSLKKIIVFFNSIEIFGKLYKKSNIDMDLDADSVFFKINRPVIALIKDKRKNSHFIVIWRATSRKLIISDPGKDYITREDISTLLPRIEYIYQIENKQSYIDKIKSIKNNFSNISNSMIFKTLYSEKKKLCLLFFTTFFVSMFSFIFSFYLGFLVDNFLSINRFSEIFSLNYLFSFMLFIITGVSAVFYLRNRIVIYLTNILEQNISYYFVDSLLNNFSGLSSGELLSRLSESLSVISSIITFVSSILTSIITSIIIFFLLSNISKIYAGILIVSALIFIIAMFFFTISIRKKNEEVLVTNVDLEESNLEIMSNIENIYNLDKKDFFLSRYKKSLDHYIEKNMSFGKLVSKKNTLYFFLGGVLSLLLINIGIDLVRKEKLSIGILLGISSYFAIIINTVQQLDTFHSNLISSTNAYRRMLVIINKNNSLRKKEEKKIFLESVTSLEFKNYYLKVGNKDLLENLNWKIFHDSNYIHLRGYSGVGKSTFCKELILNKEKSIGEVLINGYSKQKICSDSLKRNILYVSNSEMIFSDTIRNNITFGKIVSNSFLIQLLRDLELLEKILCFDEFLDANIEETSEFFSTGEKQKLIIARSIILEPSVLILDEAISNIDTIGRSKILNILKTYVQYIFLVSHDTENYDGYISYIFQNKDIRRIENEEKNK